MPLVIGNHLTGNLARDEKLLRALVVDFGRALQKNEDIFCGSWAYELVSLQFGGGGATKVPGEPAHNQ